MTADHTNKRKKNLALGAGLAAVFLAGAGWLMLSLFGPAETAARRPEAAARHAGKPQGASGTIRENGVSADGGTAPAGADGIDRPAAAELARTYDLVIRNGRVVNPETQLDRTGLNVGVEGGRIALVTDKPLKGRRVLDATGLVVSPGFIDNLSYDPNPLGVWNKIADGVTSNIAMHGGTDSPRKWYPYYERSRPPLHYGASFFYTKARNKLGIGLYQPATPEQTAKLVREAEQALNDGVLGISFSLEYVPGIGASEIVPLMKLAYKYNVPVYFHARYSDMEEPGTNMDAINEIIGYARTTGASVHVDHINSTGGTFSMKQSLGMLDAARQEGLDITACTYPYDYWGTYLNSARFDDGWQRRFRITYHDLQIAGTRDRLTATTFGEFRKQGKLAVAYAIPQSDIDDSLTAPFVMIGSDAILEPGNNNHPRASGTFARTLGLYVREHQVLTLTDAIAKMSLMPAQRLERQVPAMRKKGRIARGMDADLVVFDAGKVSDRSTVERPELTSTGIRYVVVGGKVVLDERGLHKQAIAGRPVKSEFARMPDKPAGMLDLDGPRVPLVRYRGTLYFDAAALRTAGYRTEWDDKTHTLKLAEGEPARLAAPASTPAAGELMLERGHRLAWEGGAAELLSIGNREYAPLSTLRHFGWILANEGDDWQADRA
ncbi:amidohydrolase family protein [Cohnella sp. REN36]|uniref:amidohydrolase family protein n=1 Tax=Cohnella sp. REN36 TaxID=2887347 RepID=UPI001D1550FA|nr:amidohydrolase family protein [Cohnella sp. REN36]MCC3376804.1 amidohydrolase family protein [Cohnella sp. REN36]